MLVKKYIEQNYSTPSRLGRIEIQLKGKAGDCSGAITNYEIHGAPEVAANAMVGAVRVMLMALICVLLVKLSGHNKPGSRRKSFELQNEQDIDNNNNNNYDPQQQTLEGDASGFTASQSHSYGGQSRKNGNTSDSNKSKESNFSTSQHSSTAIRRSSQPELISVSRVQQMRERERQRRHSEVILSQLKVPPGPIGLPFLGYLPFMGKEIHLTLTSLSQRFGPIYQIFLGNIRVVVLNEASLVRQAFKQPVFSGRPDTQLTRILQGYGIVNSEGALWKEQRAFLHSALRKLGAKSLMSGSNGLESKIQNQVKEFVNDLSVNADEGKPCQVRPIVARAVSSVVGSIVMNLTYRKYEEKEKFDRLIELMQEGFRLFTVAMPLDFIPIFRFLPGVRYAYKKIKENRAETSAFFQGVADEHRRYLSETFNLDSPCTASSLHPTRHTAVSSANSGIGGSSSPPTTASQAEQVAAMSAGAGGARLAAAIPGNKQAVASPDSASISSTTASSSTSSSSSSSSSTSSSPSQAQAPAPAPTSTSEAAAAPSPVFLNRDGTGSGEGKKQDAGRDEADQRQQVRPKVELDDIVVRDLVDAYIVQQKKHETDGKENYFSDQQLVQIMSDIFSAGLETVTSTIEWSILFLILNPSCQQQIQLEIDRVIGRGRLPQLEDLAHMPYTEATIYEVIRRSNVVALGNAHATLADASIGGYLIPKGTQVLTNLYGMNMNPKLWNEPDKFDPTRFIVNEKATKPDYFIPFSVGRRMCLGDLLAKMEVFLFLVGLLQKYDLCVADEDRLNPPQVKGTIGISHTPAAFKVALKSHQVRPAAVLADGEQRNSL